MRFASLAAKLESLLDEAACAPEIAAAVRAGLDEDKGLRSADMPSMQRLNQAAHRYRYRLICNDIADVLDGVGPTVRVRAQRETVNQFLWAVDARRVWSSGDRGEVEALLEAEGPILARVRECGLQCDDQKGAK